MFKKLRNLFDIEPCFMYSFSFEKLEVWQLARNFTAFVYQISEKFPNHEKYGLASQLRRASISITSNLAEGAGRTSSKEQANFYQRAYSSAMEAINQLIIANDLKYINHTELDLARSQVSEISNKINALRKAALSKIRR